MSRTKSDFRSIDRQDKGATVTNGGVANPEELVDVVRSIVNPEEVEAALESFVHGMRHTLFRDVGYIGLSTVDVPAGGYQLVRWISPTGEALTTPCPPMQWCPECPVHTGGILGHLIEGGTPRILHDVCVDADPVLGRSISKCRSLASTPVYGNDHVTAWTVVYSEARNHFSLRDLELVILLTNLVAQSLSYLRTLAELRRADERIRFELRRMAAIQTSLLPSVVPQIDGVSIAASYRPFELSGGDLYDVLREPPSTLRRSPVRERWAVLIGDASGHGPSATVMMAMTQALMRSCRDWSPAQTLSFVNQHLCQGGLPESFVTAFLGIYEPSDRCLTYARAGHPPPLLLKSAIGKDVRWLDDVGDLPLGVREDTEYAQARIAFEPTDHLVCYTDGVVEAMSPDGFVFGSKALEDVVVNCSGGAREMVNAVSEALISFEREEHPMDDQTIVVLHADR